MKTKRNTRGSGYFEGYLAKQRAAIARKYIGAKFSQGRILDLGCGTYPLFLSTMSSFTKYAIDKLEVENIENIHFFKEDLENGNRLPFDDGFFEAVSALAVVEHLDAKSVRKTLLEANRVLKKNGLLVLTTPADWSDRILRFMAALNIVSRQEVSEHKSLFNPGSIKHLLNEIGFRRVRTGSFELGMNLFAIAEK